MVGVPSSKAWGRSKNCRWAGCSRSLFALRDTCARLSQPRSSSRNRRTSASDALVTIGPRTAAISASARRVSIARGDVLRMSLNVA